jgi:CRISPR-associated protein Cmr4
MYKTIKTLFLNCETPLHAGSGDSLGIVDLPIQRERHTSIPKIEASSLKGAIREAFETKEEDRKKDILHDVFGPDEKYTDREAHAGAVAFSDARLLLFPIKSVKGVYAYATCPRILQRLSLDLKTSGISNIPTIPKENTVTQNTVLLVKNDIVILEEYSFTVKKDESTTSLANWLSNAIIPEGSEFSYWREKLKNSLVILSDDEFKDFVNLSTEVITRTKIDNETGTVETGALFTEEYLPQESVLYSLVMASPLFVKKDKYPKEVPNGKSDEVMKYITDTFSNVPVFQLGGNATLGKGLLRTKLLGEK